MPRFVRFAGLAASFAVLFLSARGVDARCTRDTSQWVDRCASLTDLVVDLVLCPAGAVSLDVAMSSSPPVRVEVTGDPERGFESVVGYGVAVVGEFPDWYGVGPEIRVPFDGILECLKADPTLQIPSGELQPTGRSVRWRPGERSEGASEHGGGPGSWRSAAEYSPPIPWRLLLAIVLGGFVFWSEGRTHTRRARLRVAGSMAGLTVATFAVGVVAYPQNFFHQNGQGPLWVLFSMCRDGSYGPGYRELFGWLTQYFSASPDTAIFYLQAILGALWPAWVWVSIRSLGVRPALAWIGAGWVAMDPVLGTIAHSETYYGTALTLMFPATAVLAVGSRLPSERRVKFVVAVVCAGLLISQSARVHPVGWLASAFVPIVVLVGEGKLVARLLWAALAGLGIALVVVLSSGGALWDVYHGELGTQWSGSVKLRIDGNTLLLLSSLWMVPLLLLSKLRFRALVNGALAFLVVATAMATNMVGIVNEILAVTMPRLFLPAGIAAAAAALREVDLGRWRHGAIVASVLIAGSTTVIHQWGLRDVRFTDQLEQRFLAEVRDQVPEESVVIYVGRGEKRVLQLPFYGECTYDSAVAEFCGGDALCPSNPDLYYRSSLCSTEEGQPMCDAIEERWQLEPIETATLPARVSISYLPPYLTDEVTVGLYRITGPP